MISTIAGTGIGGYNGDNIPATTATLGYFSCIAVDVFGNTYIADPNNRRVREVDIVTGIITTVAGNGTVGYSGDGGLAVNAQFNSINRIALNSNGDLYIVDAHNHRIRRVDRVTGVVTTIAGNGIGSFSGDGGSAIAASLNLPIGIAFDKDDNLYIGDNENHRIRKVDVNGIITTIAGTGDDSCNGDGGNALLADIHGFYDICTDKYSNVYLACMNDMRIRKIDQSTGIISTVAGDGSVGSGGDGNLATAAQLRFPFGNCVDKDDNLYIADRDNHKIRRVDANGIITTIAGTGILGFSGDGALASAAQLNYPSGVVVDTCSNLYIADKENKRLRKVTFNDSCGVLNVRHINPLTLTLSPNPATSQITITSNNQLKEISIHNTLGQQVLHQSCNSNRVSVTIEDLQTGVYFIRVSDSMGGVKVEKIIKQ